MPITAIRTAPAISTAGDVGATRAFFLLRTVFTIAPIAFGLDKFFGLLTDWEDYLAPGSTTSSLAPRTGPCSRSV